MIENVLCYTIDERDIFEEVLDKGGYRLNHVIIEPGKIFPAHPTDAEVTIIITKGILTLKLAAQETAYYHKGQVVEVPKGTLSELGNTSEAYTEVFVIKS